MKRHHVIIVIIIGVIILSLSLWGIPNKQPTRQVIANTKSEALTKRNILRQDAKQTAHMLIVDVRHDLEQMLGQWQHKYASKKMRKNIQQFLTLHPHFVYVKWIGANRTTSWTNGQLPTCTNWQTKKQLIGYIRTAAVNILKRQSYVSPNILINGKKHIVIGVLSPYAHYGVVTVIKQQMKQQVQNQQQKNLRLIPYPPATKYNVKSVDADSMKKVQVKTGDDNAGTSHYYRNELVVRFHKKLTTKQLQRIKQDIACQNIRQLGHTYIFRAQHMTVQQLMDYFSTFHPIYQEPHFLYMTNDITAAEEPNDTLYKAYQWNLPNIHTNYGWQTSKGTKGVIIAVIDTGVDIHHRDLQTNLLRGYNVFHPQQAPVDEVGHGTHVTGIIGASVNNNEGVAGISWYNPILPVKALDSSGAGTSYSVAKGIIWATNHGAKVINLSLGNYVDGVFLREAIQYAYQRDVVLVAATGNDNTRRPGYPAAYPEVFAVAATDEKGQRATYANYGIYVDVVAPGTSIASTYLNNQYAALSGTSMACPHAATLAALIRSLNPELTNKEVYEIMRQSAIDLGKPGKDIYYGYGKIDIERALHIVKEETSSVTLFPQHIARKLKKTIAQYEHTQATK